MVSLREWFPFVNSLRFNGKRELKVTSQCYPVKLTPVSLLTGFSLQDKTILLFMIFLQVLKGMQQTSFNLTCVKTSARCLLSPLKG